MAYTRGIAQSGGSSPYASQLAQIGRLQNDIKSGYEGNSNEKLGYWGSQEKKNQVSEIYKRTMDWNQGDMQQLAQVQDDDAKATAQKYLTNPKLYNGVQNTNELLQNEMRAKWGVGASQAVADGGKAGWGAGNQQLVNLDKAEQNTGKGVAQSLRDKAGFDAALYDQSNAIYQPEAGTAGDPFSWIGHGGYSSQGIGSGDTASWVAPGLGDSNDPVSGTSTGAPKTQGEQRQYEDLLNRQRHDPGIFQDFDRNKIAADLQKSYKTMAPTNRGAADNYNPQPAQGMLSPITGGPVGAPGKITQMMAQQSTPGVFTNPMQRWTNEDGSKQLTFGKQGEAIGEDGRYTPATDLYMKGRPENGGRKYSGLQGYKEYLAQAGGGQAYGGDPTRDYGQGQTGAGAGPIAVPQYKENPTYGESNVRYGVGPDGVVRPVSGSNPNSYDGYMQRTHQGEYNAHQGKNGEMLSYPQKQRDFEALQAAQEDQNKATQDIRKMPGLSGYTPELGTIDSLKQQQRKFLADSNSSFTGSYSGGSGEGRAEPKKKLGPLDVIKKTFEGSGQSWKPAPAPSPVPKGEPGVPSVKGVDGVRMADGSDPAKYAGLGDAPGKKKGLLDVVKEPLKGVVDSYRGLLNEEVDKRLEAQGIDQEATMHMGLAAKRKMLKHWESMGGDKQDPQSIMQAPSGGPVGESGMTPNGRMPQHGGAGSPMNDVFAQETGLPKVKGGEPGSAMRFVHRMDGDTSQPPKGYDLTPNRINRSAISPANDVFEKQNDTADHGNYDGRGMSLDRSGMLEGRLAAQLGVSTVPNTPADGWKLSADQIKQAQPSAKAPKDGWMVKAPREDAKPGNYRTELSPKEEKQFAAWVKKTGAQFDPSANNPKEDYDMRGFYKAVQAGDPAAVTAMSSYDGKPHYPDTYKTPYHETFSDQSKWAIKGKAPHWQGDRLMSPSGQVLKDETPQQVSPITRGFQKLSKMNPAAAELFRRAYAARH